LNPEPQSHFDRLLHWLDLEGRAEADERRAKLGRTSAVEAERLGTTLIDMAVEDENAGLGGRWLWTLCKRNRTLKLPWTRLGTGAPVVLTTGDAEVAPLRGVISRRDERSLTIALPAPPDDVDSSGTFRIDLSTDETARERQRTALRTMRSAKHGRQAQWRDLLLGAREPRFHEERPITPLDTALNDAQREAVRFALSADDLAIIHGPPGTGKTTTLVEFVRQAVARGEKVLVASGSNLGVDNVLERLAATDVRAVRLGHPARVLPSLRSRTLDYLLEAHPDVAVAEKLRKQAAEAFRMAGRWTRAKPQPGERASQRAEARRLLDDARRLEETIENHLLDEADVICATLTGLDPRIVGDREFDWVVIDEAAQATEPPCWIPLVRSKKLLLAGDHCQLPPTVVSKEAAAAGFAVSLMERLMQRGGAAWSRLLEVQYRMHEQIMSFSSQQFYEGRLVADPSVAARSLAELPGVTAGPATDGPLDLIDTAGAGFEEAAAAHGESRFNESEAKLVVRKVQALLDAGVAAADIAVITPYAAQVRLLRERIADPDIEIDSVDGFQGREKEAIVVSLVRSNDDGEIGFLSDVRRMNVALTRARRRLVVIGDGAVLGGHPFYRALLGYFEANSGYHSVWEEPLE
jgi:superfamily I DNA and/or RNA helicase